MGLKIVLFAGVWTFSLLPALCTAGVLVHPCDCESNDGCGHESECSDDPCASVAPPREENAGEVTPQSCGVVLILDSYSGGVVDLELIGLRPPLIPTLSTSAAYFDSDLPLLI